MNREKIMLSDGWKFLLGEEKVREERGWYMGLDDSGWETVSVPHDWSVKYPFSEKNSSGTGYVRGGEAWYRKSFNLKETKGKKVYITFEGVYNNSRVWINSNYLGKRPYGYSTFTHDITEFVREGNNVVSVMVSHKDIADSRWFTGSGIVRPVYLTVTDEAAAEYGGIKITAAEVSEEKAVINVETKTTMEGLRVANTVIDRFGRSVAGFEGGSVEISRPLLWSPDEPNLYTMKTDVFRDGQLTDSVETVFGIRYFSLDPDKGFFLNGKSMKLKGVCLHHDGGCLGAAVPKSVWRRRLLKLKECGCNAIRTSHNPPDPALPELCDELGFLVMDEAFDEWEGPKNKWWQGHNVYPPKLYGYYEDFPKWGEEDIKTMVRRDRNHPSIIMWSIGNEVDYPNDPYVHPLFDEVIGNNDANKPKEERIYDDKRPNAERLAKIAEKLVRWVKEEDITRPVTAALAFPELSNETGYAAALDIVGYNYKEQLYEKDHERFPGRVIFGSENSHYHKAWEAVRDNDYICGQFLWTGIDYMGEAHGWPVRASGAGLLDMAGFPKLRFFQRRAMWRDEPFAALGARPRPEREERFRPFGDEWSFEPDALTEVICYTNQREAELFLNGESLGKGEYSDRAGGFVWNVKYAEGKLRAVCGEAEATLETAYEACRVETEVIAFDDDDVQQIEITLADKNGNTAIADSREIRVQTEGAELMGLENGNIADCRSYSESARNAFRGRLICYVRKTSPHAAVYIKAGDLESKISLKQSLREKI